MIDIHSHILPGIDDGSRDLATSLAMAKRAVEDGITTMIVTPHGMSDDYTAILEARTNALEQLKAEVAKNNLPLRFLTGLECYMSDKVFDMVKKMPQAAMNYQPGRPVTILMELPMDMDLKFMPELLFRAQLKDIQLVLAHPERYDGFSKSVSLLKELLDKGLYIQMNATSLNTAWWNFSFNKAVRELFQYCPEQIFLASDAHNNKRRPPVLTSVKDKIVSWIGRDGWNKVTHDNAVYLFDIEE